MIIVAATTIWARVRDPGVVRPLVLLVVATLGPALWCWFVFASGYSRSARNRVFWGVPALLAALVACVKIEKVGGALDATLAWRWSQPHDRTLDHNLTPKEAAPADLTVTSPYDFPQFLGPARDSTVSNVALSPDWKGRPPRELWRREIGAGWSGFAAINGFAITLEQRGHL
ncbi:MAG TPA: hypothetical protein VIY86_12490, partial [Pirellulaceae bacterium]